MNILSAVFRNLMYFLGVLITCTDEPETDVCIRNKDVKVVKNNDTIKIVTYNVKQLFFFSNLTNVKKITEYLLKEDYDIICLQEVFDERSRNRFEKLMEAKYTNIIKRVGKNKIYGLAEDSGLMIFTRFEVTHINHIIFEGKDTFIDNLANKGAVRVGIKLNDKHSIDFIGTHLSSDPKIAKLQFEQVKLLDPQKNTILVGDLNMNYHNEQFSSADYRDKTLYEILDNVPKSTVIDGEKVIDYIIFISESDIITPQTIKVNTDIPYSDHYPVLATFKFTE